MAEFRLISEAMQPLFQGKEREKESAGRGTFEGQQKSDNEARPSQHVFEGQGHFSPSRTSFFGG